MNVHYQLAWIRTWFMWRPCRISRRSLQVAHPFQASSCVYGRLSRVPRAKSAVFLNVSRRILSRNAPRVDRIITRKYARVGRHRIPPCDSKSPLPNVKVLSARRRSVCLYAKRDEGNGRLLAKRQEAAGGQGQDQSGR